MLKVISPEMFAAIDEVTEKILTKVYGISMPSAAKAEIIHDINVIYKGYKDAANLEENNIAEDFEARFAKTDNVDIV